MQHLKDLEKVLINSGLDYRGNKVIDDYFLTAKINAVRDSYRCCQDNVAEAMVKWAELDDSLSILESGAGKGVILNKIKHFTDHHYYEIQMPFVVNYLSGISRNWDGVNFFDCDRKFDRILMNPPFSFGEYIKHILFGYEKLEANGLMVFLYPKTAEFKEVANKDFIEFLEKVEKRDVGKVCGECECIMGKVIKL